MPHAANPHFSQAAHATSARGINMYGVPGTSCLPTREAIARGKCDAAVVACWVRLRSCAVGLLVASRIMLSLTALIPGCRP